MPPLLYYAVKELQDLKQRVFALLLSVMFLVLPGCAEDETDSPVILTLACWIKDLEIQYLVETYNTSQSAYEIQIKDYYDGGIKDDPDTAFARMNIELISGDIPDLFYMDSMDTMSLINAGILADIYPFIDADETFHESDYLMHIVSLFEYDGALYEFAPCFQISALYGPQSILGERSGWTIEEFEAFDTSLGDPTCALALIRSSMLGYMTQYAIDNYIDVVNGSCNFDSDGFVRWLEFVGRFPNNSSSDWENSVLMPATMLASVYEYIQHREYIQDYPVYVGYPSDYAGGPCAMAQCSFGIAETTKHPEACWDFIKLLLTEQQQGGVISSLGFPILRSSLEAQFEKALESTDDQYCITVDEEEYLLNLIESLEYARFRYEDIQTIIREESEAFFAGDATSEIAAARIQGRVSIYLAEKR